MLLHIAEHERALDAMPRALKPGGSLVLEESDFTAARAAAGTEAARRASGPVHEAIEVYVPLARDGGCARLSASAAPRRSRPRRGGSDIAEMMRLSALQLHDKYLATGKASGADLEAYGRFAQTPGRWAVCHATVRPRATKPPV